jgi:hypothetical protein
MAAATMARRYQVDPPHARPRRPNAALAPTSHPVICCCCCCFLSKL